MSRFALRVNGRDREVEVEAGSTLLGALRDELGLTGARVGCGEGRCGACHVLIDNASVPACTTPIEAAVGHAIVTVEAAPPAIQAAFLAEGAMQCGYCTSGMVIGAAALLARTPDPTDDEIRDALAVHLCRCGVYGRIVQAVRRAAEASR